MLSEEKKIPNPLGINQYAGGYEKKVYMPARISADLVERVNEEIPRLGSRTAVLEEALEQYFNEPASQIDAARLLNEIKRLNPRVKLSLRELETAIKAAQA